MATQDENNNNSNKKERKTLTTNLLKFATRINRKDSMSKKDTTQNWKPFSQKKNIKANHLCTQTLKSRQYTRNRIIWKDEKHFRIECKNFLSNSASRWWIRRSYKNENTKKKENNSIYKCLLYSECIMALTNIVERNDNNNNSRTIAICSWCTG